MRPHSAELATYLATTRELIYTDVYTFELLGGTDLNYRLHYTSGQQNLTTYPVDGSPSLVTYAADKVLIEGLRFRASISLDVDEQQVVITPTEDATVRSIPFLAAVQQRMFDGATVRRDRFFFENHGGSPIGGIPLFHGLVSTFDRVGRSQATLKVKSASILLNQKMPRHLFQPSCIYTLYDAGCGLDKIAHGVAGLVGASPTKSVIPWSGANSGYALGSIFFENMGNVGTWRTIRTATATELTLAYPLPEMPLAGDQFAAFPGCDRSAARCAALGNSARRRSYDFIPQAEKAI